MNNEKSKLILALLLIKKGDPLNNSYSLTRILEWKFRTINSRDLLARIRDEYYVEYDLIKGVHYYKLASSGRELIVREYDAALVFLLQNYPENTEMISSLFNSF